MKIKIDVKLLIKLMFFKWVGSVINFFCSDMSNVKKVCCFDLWCYKVLGLFVS